MIALPSPKFPKPQYRRATRPVKKSRAHAAATMPAQVEVVPAPARTPHPLETDVPQAVYRILTTSETPARDLLELVEDGLMDAAEATQALQGTGLNIADVQSAAAFETDRLRAEGLLK